MEKTCTSWYITKNGYCARKLIHHISCSNDYALCAAIIHADMAGFYFLYPDLISNAPNAHNTYNLKVQAFMKKYDTAIKKSNFKQYRFAYV